MSLTSLFAALALQTAAPAAPVSVSDCVVGAVPPAATQEMISRYSTGGAGDATKAITDAVIHTVVAACSDSTPEGRAKLDAIGEILAGHAMMQGAQASLVSRHKIPGDRLEKAWLNLSAGERQSFLDEDQQDDATVEALMKFVGVMRPDVTLEKIATLDDSKQLTGESAEIMNLLLDASYYGIGRSIVEAPPAPVAE